MNTLSPSIGLEIPNRLPVHGPHIQRYPDPDGTYTRELSEIVWAPTETKLGRVERYAITKPGLETSVERYAGLEHLAAAGMRRTFERFGIQVSLSGAIHQDPKQSHVELVKRSLSLAFPSHAQLKETVDNHAESVPGTTLRIASASGKFTPIAQMEEFTSGNLLLSAEQTPDNPDLTYFWGSYYMHDMLEHFPGWLSLPPEVLIKLRACAVEAVDAYKKDPPGFLFTTRAADRANTRLLEVADIIDRQLDIYSLGKFLAEGDPGFGRGMAHLLGGRALDYEKQLKEYIADHADDDVLRIA